MPKCSNCRNEWSWTTCMKMGFKFQRGVACEFCGEKQYQTQASMKKTSLYSMSPLLLLPLLIILDLSVSLSLGIFLVPQLIVIAMFPFTLELSMEEEPLW
ncbi:TIGR04104 family putative zinc finger protein [Halobacillus sp. K22]|uniref:TIGR04104 family putative zinc finger protein n=1 Tax=Halobacillus sp. K22 TaxID=3457431 RepID=UPI003FCE75FA